MRPIRCPSAVSYTHLGVSIFLHGFFIAFFHALLGFSRPCCAALAGGCRRAGKRKKMCIRDRVGDGLALCDLANQALPGFGEGHNGRGDVSKRQPYWFLFCSLLSFFVFIVAYRRFLCKPFAQIFIRFFDENAPDLLHGQPLAPDQYLSLIHILAVGMEASSRYTAGPPRPKKTYRAGGKPTRS